MGLFLGIDTSCYTTSVACVDEKGIVYEKRTVLSVKLGQRGLCGIWRACSPVC